MLSDLLLLSFLLACPALFVLICFESRRRSRQDEKSYRTPGLNKHTSQTFVGWMSPAGACHGAGRRGISPWPLQDSDIRSPYSSSGLVVVSGPHGDVTYTWS